MVFSASLPVSCVSRTGGRAMWEMKRGLPSGEGELDLDQLWVRRTCVLCTPNHLSLKGMFMFAHFSPSIVPEEAGLMRKMTGRVSEMQAQAQIPTFSHACFESRFWHKWVRADIVQAAVMRWSGPVYGKTVMLQWVMTMGLVAASQYKRD